MRLIDADKLLKNYKKWIPQLSSKEDEGDRRGVETCIAVLEDTPAVDAVPVVRKPVVGYEGYYEVDQFGRVFSVDRVISVDDNGRKYEKPIA